ncbi:hypothetical protein [Alkaliphilus serpentinus]|uniref:Zinc-finger domain-containing protein n=1 Tax=Alkaliphilus serpentinus TaxID=1482731 RepID=A0A833HPC4_9FIRM|nr:hypothetical protein [Alkaliphilus serpentinus]KAB3530548.1 hypothetical protein F8153_06780 [Alkaliphilus serpentinus]
MKHYDQKYWKAYTLNIIDEDDRIEMENHLYSCDECMDIYLQHLDEIHEEEFRESATFTKTVMSSIYQIEERKNKVYRFKLFKYYAIAASITLILVSTGVFDVIGRSTPKLMTALDDSTHKIEMAMFGGWSQEIFDRGKSIFNNFSINIKE